MATVAFMNSVLEYTPIKSNRDHLHMIVDCNPKVPDINAAILGSGPSAAAALAASGRRRPGGAITAQMAFLPFRGRGLAMLGRSPNP